MTIATGDSAEAGFGAADAMLFAAPAEGTNPIFVILLQVAVIGAIIYFLLIRPQRKERERHQAMIEALKRGDVIVTAGGIIGTVIHAEQDKITIRTAENTRIVIQRGRVAQRLGEEP